jgi:ABC-type transporter Mla subunit MlaD
MRRIAALLVVLTLAGVGALVLGTAAQGSSQTYKFDVIFDDARGLIAGQQVKIAGAEAGSVTNVVVTTVVKGTYKARVEATITGPFQFHTDASCIIRPDGLIAEDYLDCDPGSKSKPLLKGQNGFPPTVSYQHTSEPVSLLDLFNIFNLPTRERFQVLVDELGIATAGNGDQINSILQRANPTLQAAQRVIAILDKQDNQIANEIDATNEIAQAGANHIDDVRDFIKQAAGLTKLTSDHSSSLEQAIDKLPGYLQASTPALKELNTVAADGTPLLKNLYTAAPYLNKVDNDIVPFTKLARPALSKLSTAISTVIPDAKSFTPLITTLGHYLNTSAGTTAQFSSLIDNLIDHGFSENFLSVLYYTAGALSKYDANSHMLDTYLDFPGDGLCGMYATTPSATCNAHYGTSPAYTPARDHEGTSTNSTTGSTTTTTPGTATTGAQTSTSPTGSTTSTNPVSGLVNKIGSTLQGLGNNVSSGVNATGGTVNKVLGGGKGSSSSGSSTSSGSLSNLLSYLLK